MPGLCADALRAQRVQQAKDRLAAGERWTETGIVFTTRLGSGMDAANVRRDLRRALALVPGLNPADWTPRELRHSQAVTMEIYAKASSEATREALRRLGESLN